MFNYQINKYLNKIKVINDCWIWQGAKSKMQYKNSVVYYGKIMFKSKTRQAHRLFYISFKGEIPKGLELDHLCRNTLCVNPEHLQAVTHSENMKRGKAHLEIVQRASLITHCPQKHEYTKENTYIFKNQRRCKECNRQRAKLYQQNKRKQAIAKAEGKE